MHARQATRVGLGTMRRGLPERNTLAFLMIVVFLGGTLFVRQFTPYTTEGQRVFLIHIVMLFIFLHVKFYV